MPDLPVQQRRDRTGSSRAALLPRRALFGDSQKRAPQLSPDAKWISFIAPHRGAPNIWLAPAEDMAAARPLTSQSGHGIMSCRWSPDNRRLCYVTDNNGDENYHVFSLSIDGGEPADLTPIPGIAARIIAGSRLEPNKLLVGLNDRDRRWHDVYMLDLAAGTRELVLRNDRFISFHADRHLKLRLAVSPASDGGFDYMVPDDAGGWRLLVQLDEEDVLATSIAGFGPPDAHIAYCIDSRGRDKAAAVVVDVITGTTTEIFADPNAEVVGMLIDPLDHQVQAVRTMFLRPAWHIIDPRVRDDFARLETLDAGEIHIISRSADDRHWLVAHAGDLQSGMYRLYDRDSGTARPVFPARPALAGAHLQPMADMTIPARDGLAIPTYLTRPRTGDGAPGAMVLLVHGGPWSRDSWGFNPWHQWVADRGYAALSVSYRGSIGFGKSYCNAGNREWGGRMQDDLIDAVRWAIDNGIADPRRIAIMGASYGGYATLVGLSFTPDVFACGIDIFGPSDLEALIANIPPYWQPLIAMWHRRVGDITTEEGRAFLRARSPLHRADQISKPLLISHGANDPRLSIAASEDIVAAVSRNGQPVIFLRYPDEGHNLIREENRLSLHAVAELFLARYLGGVAEPVGSDFQGSSMIVECGTELLAELTTPAGASPS